MTDLDRTERERKATDLASGEAAIAAGLAGDVSEKAAALAYEKGQDDARTEAHFAKIDEHLGAVNGSIEDTATELKHLSEQFRVFEVRQIARDAVSAALAEAVEKQTDSQISMRQFVIGVLATIIALSAVIVGAVA